MIRNALFQSLVALAGVLTTWLLIPVPTWHIDIGTKQAQRYTTEFRATESAALASSDQTFQWAFSGSGLIVAQPTVARVVTLHTLQRSEQPPAQVTVGDGHSLAVALPAGAGTRTQRLLLPAATHLRITCDATNVSDPVLQPLCIALLSAQSTPQRGLFDAIGLLHLLSVGVLCAWVATVTLPTRGMQTLGTLSLTALVCGFPAVVSVSWLGIACILALWGVAATLVRLRTRAPWLRYALGAASASVSLKAAGILSPGYQGTDIGFHVHKYEAVLAGHIYQIADGQGLTYPYPPTVYTLLALVAVPLHGWVSPEHLIHVTAAAIDASTIVLLAWVAARAGWSTTRIASAAALYAVLPAGYLLQWQATVAQTIGQWFGFIAVAATLTNARTALPYTMALAMVGHFGAFLSLHLTYTLALASRTLRSTAVRWWGVFGVVGLLFYSQYASTIWQQLGALQNSDATSSIGQRWWQFAWGYGLVGHYAGVFAALGALGITMLRPSRLRAMATASYLTTTLLLIAQVGADIDVTRYVVYLYPFVVLTAAVVCAALWRSRAGRVVVWALIAGVAYQSAAAWFAGVTAGVRLGFLW